jgi:hypothetical protein
MIVQRWRQSAFAGWILTSDGENPTGTEIQFVSESDTRESQWNCGKRMERLCLTLRPNGRLGKIVKIRGEDHTVVKAINRSLAQPRRVGQIIFHRQTSRSDRGRLLASLKQVGGF